MTNSSRSAASPESEYMSASAAHPSSAVTIYTTAMCPYCHAAKQLLKKKGIAYDEIDVSFDPAGRRAMTERAGGRQTVPQIFVGATHVGGCAHDRPGFPCGQRFPSRTRADAVGA
jgi:glutaredoxin 3